MPRDERPGSVGLQVSGIYERIRTRELKLAFEPDPRLHFVKDSPMAYDAATVTAPKYGPTVLYQVDELLERKPVRLASMAVRWACHLSRGERLGTIRQPVDTTWFILSVDDTLVPA
jgi:hypothetical protein